MKKQGPSLSILASAMVVTLAAPGGVWAGGGRYDNGGHDNGYQKKGQYNSHYNSHYNAHYNNHYSNYYSNYYRGGQYYYPSYQGYKSCGNNNHHNNNNNNNDKLWIGLLGGGIVGYTLSNIHLGY